MAFDFPMRRVNRRVDPAREMTRDVAFRVPARIPRAAFIEIGACRIALALAYAHAVEAVQGRTAWAHRTATLRRRKASSRRTGIGGTDPSPTLLYQLVAEHYPRYRNRRATEGRALPRYVEEEFEAYLSKVWFS